MRAGQPERVVALYARAASEPNTIYGMLAAHLMAAMSDRNWKNHRWTEHRCKRFWTTRRCGAPSPSGKSVKRAPSSPNSRAPSATFSPELDPAFAAVARVLGAPSLGLRAAETSASRDLFLASLYPVPDYAPKGGYQLDRAMLLAFAHQESRSVANAEVERRRPRRDADHAGNRRRNRPRPEPRPR